MTPKSSLEGKHVVLGITGSIAAYKAAILVRLLVKQGAEVQVIITPSGKEFITPTTLSALSSKPVISDFFSDKDGVWNSHVDIGLWADIMIIAPASASTIGKLAHGISDNMLVTTYLSMKAPVFIAPAMDLDMYKHPSTIENIELLRRRGNYIIECDEGELASHLIGKGRMQEPSEIVQYIERYFNIKRLYNNKKLKGKKIIITAGPTHEYIDPVRYIGNKSSGLMGISIANTLAACGSQVTLILGPSNISANPNVKTHRVVSAKDMLKETQKYIKNCDIAIFAAAVADYSPLFYNKNKIKRNEESTITIELARNTDIALEMGKKKKNGQFFIGFSLETDKGYEEAKRKLKQKNLDAIILNSLQDKGAGFESKTNKITIFKDDESYIPFELKDKNMVAIDIINFICDNI